MLNDARFSLHTQLSLNAARIHASCDCAGVGYGELAYQYWKDALDELVRMAGMNHRFVS